MIVNLCHGDGTWYNQKSNYSIEVSNEFSFFRFINKNVLSVCNEMWFIMTIVLVTKKNIGPNVISCGIAYDNSYLKTSNCKYNEANCRCHYQSRPSCQEDVEPWTRQCHFRIFRRFCGPSQLLQTWCWQSFQTNRRCVLGRTCTPQFVIISQIIHNDF